MRNVYIKTGVYKKVKRAVRIFKTGETYEFDIEKNPKIEKILYFESEILKRNYVDVYWIDGTVQRFFDLDYVAFYKEV